MRATLVERCRTVTEVERPGAVALVGPRPDSRSFLSALALLPLKSAVRDDRSLGPSC